MGQLGRMRRLGSNNRLGWAVLAVCGFLTGVVAAETQPADHWACFGPQAESLPRYWRLLASQHPTVDREVRLYERVEDAADADGDACRVEYQRSDQTRVLWFARYQRGYCRPRAEHLIQRLTASGFNCVKLDSSDRLQHAEPGSPGEIQAPESD